VLPETGRPRAANPPSLSPETGRQRIILPPPVSDELDEDEFEMEDDQADMEDEPQSLPVPEPEAQPLQRPVSGQQRHIRRIDRSGADLPRGSRNTPSGDVIDIPAFLRKR
jgi:cell division protein FtsZ